jgi:hypothetical protein
VERGGSEIPKIERQLEDGREKVRRASDEEARLKDEQPDQNAVYLRGPGPVRSGRSRGPAARVPSSLPGVDSLSPRVLGWIAAAVIVLVIIIIAAGH